jgi:hypothetical protein
MRRQIKTVASLGFEPASTRCRPIYRREASDDGCGGHVADHDGAEGGGGAVERRAPLLGMHSIWSASSSAARSSSGRKLRRSL